MELALLVPPLLESRLEVLLGGAHRLRRVANAYALERRIRRAPVDAALVDPLLDPERLPGILVKLKGRFPSVPVLVYTRLAPESLRVVAELSRAGFHHIVLHRFDDSREQLEAILADRAGAPLRMKLIDHIRPALSRLPDEMRDSVTHVFERPHEYSGIRPLAKALEIAPSTFYRRCWDAGFPSPRKLFVGARVLTGYGYLREPGYSVADVATKLGYRDIEVFNANVRAVFETTPRKARRLVAEDDAVRRVGDWILSA